MCYQHYSLSHCGLTEDNRTYIHSLLKQLPKLMRSMSSAYSVDSIERARNLSEPFIIGRLTWLFHEYAIMETLRTKFKPIKTCDVCRFTTRNDINAILREVMRVVEEEIKNRFPDTELMSYDETVDTYNLQFPSRLYPPLDITILWRLIHIEYLYSALDLLTSEETEADSYEYL